MSDAPSRPPSRRGRTLKLYLADGTPSGVMTAELGLSSVRAAVASRTALPKLICRGEAMRAGVYLLVGPDPDLSGRQLVYVGEGDQVKSQLDTPSGAGSLVFGGNVNGPEFWRHSATGKRYGEWRASLIGEGDAS